MAAVALDTALQARYAANDSAGYTATDVFKHDGPVRNEIARLVATFLVGENNERGLSGPQMLYKTLKDTATSLKKVLPPDSHSVSEAALSHFLIREVLSGDSDRLKRCIEEELISVVFDVLFSKGQIRIDVLNQIPGDALDTFVCKAAKKGHSRCLHQVLSHQVFTDKLDNETYGYALCDAASHGQLESLLEIASHPVALAAIDEYRFTDALCDAARNNNIECFRALLAHDAINSIGEDWDLLPNHPIESAAANGHIECLLEIFAHQTLVPLIFPEDISEALIGAYIGGHVSCLQALLSHPDLMARIPEDSFDEVVRQLPRKAPLECLELLFVHSARISETPLKEALELALDTHSRETHVVIARSEYFWTELTDLEEMLMSKERRHTLLHEFNLLFSTDMTRDVLALHGDNLKLVTPEQKNAFKECMTRVLVGYARGEGDSIRKQKAQQFLHSIWVRHGSPETDEGPDFAPNHMWDSLPVFAGAFLDCQMG